jgi:uncharacterized protein YdeI (YjbR/CyaY-like superfamily)
MAHKKKKTASQSQPRAKKDPAAEKIKPTAEKLKKVSKTFRAAPELAGKLGWTIIYLPFDVEKTWGTRKQLRVKGDINGFAFITSAFPTKTGRHFVLITKPMKKCGRATAGTVASFRMEPDTADRTLPESKELLAELKQDKALFRWYEKHMTPGTRRWFTKWINSTKTKETRQRRAGQMAECLYSAMDAERELPPVIRRMMDEDPKSYIGWEKMTPTQRRGELLGIFFYRNPESQRRRIERAINIMLEKAEKTRG